MDWEDDYRLDRKNCSSTFLIAYVNKLRDVDPQQADVTVQQLRAAAAANDIFAQKHLKALLLADKGVAAGVESTVASMFSGEADFLSGRFKLLTMCSEYDKKAKKLHEDVRGQVVSQDMTTQFAEANEHEDYITIRASDCTKDMPICARGANATLDSKGGKLVEIDTDDPAWRQRQKDILGAFVEPVVPMEEYKNALSTLHVKQRSDPKMPG